MLVFLKLGGSLITDKTQPYTPLPGKLNDLVLQVNAAVKEDPGLQVVLGHGSGSFGHQAASRYGTRKGVAGQEAWRGFAEVWYQASTLNRLVMEALHSTGLPVIALSPAASITAHDGNVIIWDLYPIKTALSQGLIPVVYGDVVFDDVRGGTILSTEDLFVHLAHQLHPARILLAGLETGVWKDFPARTDLASELTPASAGQLSGDLGGADGLDVTGGMKAKVEEMLSLIQTHKGLTAQIFAAEEEGFLTRALQGENVGTLLTA